MNLGGREQTESSTGVSGPTQARLPGLGHYILTMAKHLSV